MAGQVSGPVGGWDVPQMVGPCRPQEIGHCHGQAWSQPAVALDFQCQDLGLGQPDLPVRAACRDAGRVECVGRGRRVGAEAALEDLAGRGGAAGIEDGGQRGAHCARVTGPGQQGRQRGQGSQKPVHALPPNVPAAAGSRLVWPPKSTFRDSALLNRAQLISET